MDDERNDLPTRVRLLEETRLTRESGEEHFAIKLVERIVLGMVGLILIAVIGALIALVVGR